MLVAERGGTDQQLFELLVAVDRICAEDRLEEAFKHSEWGTKWIMLPNPIYGSWERSLYGFKALSNEEVLKRKLEHLKWVN